MVWILEHQKNYDDALEYCEKALDINPNYVYAISYKGKLLLSLGRYKESLEYYEKALDLEPNNQTAIYHKNKVLEKLNESKKTYFKKFRK